MLASSLVGEIYITVFVSHFGKNYMSYGYINKYIKSHLGKFM